MNVLFIILYKGFECLHYLGFLYLPYLMVTFINFFIN